MASQSTFKRKAEPADTIAPSKSPKEDARPQRAQRSNRVVYSFAHPLDEYLDHRQQHLPMPSSDSIAIVSSDATESASSLDDIPESSPPRVIATQRRSTNKEYEEDGNATQLRPGPITLQESGAEEQVEEEADDDGYGTISSRGGLITFQESL